MPDPGAVPAVYPPARRKAAIVEFSSVHEECVPALAHLLRLNAIEPTIYLNKRIKEGRPGFRARFPELADRVRFRELDTIPGRKSFYRHLARTDNDLLVINSFQLKGSSVSPEQWSGPVLGLVHNATILLNTEETRARVAEGRVGVLTLAQHVTGHLLAADHETFADTATVTSTFPFPPRVRPIRSGRRTIAIPGSVNFGSRNYQQLLDAVPGIVDRVGADNIQISVVGGGGFGRGAGPERRARLEEQVADRGLSEIFEFAEIDEQGFVPGGPYYAHLRGADFLLPSVPPDDPSFRTVKITSAIPTSIGLGVPAIVDRWTAAVYGLPAVVYRGAAVADGLDQALSMSQDALEALRARLVVHREREMERSRDEMAWALASVGLGD